MHGVRDGARGIENGYYFNTLYYITTTDRNPRRFAALLKKKRCRRAFPDSAWNQSPWLWCLSHACRAMRKEGGRLLTLEMNRRRSERARNQDEVDARWYVNATLAKSKMTKSDRQWQELFGSMLHMVGEASTKKEQTMIWGVLLCKMRLLGFGSMAERFGELYNPETGQKGPWGRAMVKAGKTKHGKPITTNTLEGGENKPSKDHQGNAKALQHCVQDRSEHMNLQARHLAEWWPMLAPDFLGDHPTTKMGSYPRR